MNPEFRQQVIEKLRKGEDLPADWARELFPPEKREYELVYHGKEREEDILAETMAVPLQPVRTYGKNGTTWNNMLIFGDNLQAMRTLLKMKENGELINSDGSKGVRLVYIDPPFATKQEFRGTQDQKAYQDKLVGAKFIEFLRKRLVLLKEILSSDGSIFVHLDYKKVHYIKVVIDELFGENNFINQIVWKRTSAHSDSKTLGNAHDIILHYSRSPNFVYKKQIVEYSADYVKKYYKHNDGKRRFLDRDLSAKGLQGQGYSYTWKGMSGYWRCPIETMKRHETDGLLYYTNKGTPRLKQYLDKKEGRSLQDIWSDINAINSQAIERIDYPTQKPESLLDRIILSCSETGDIVLDAFAGSGTTLAVAEKLGRCWIGIDCGKLAVYTIQKRLLTLKSDIGNKGKKSITPKPFTVFNAGLYDFSTLKKLPWVSWRFFALQLFECRDEPHEIGGMKLDGMRRGSSVLVFDHTKASGNRIDEETIQTIHNQIGKKIGNRFFIIAPKGVFAFQQDYLDLDNVRYYALRIPYSVISELHRRNFSALQQPNNESDVNDIVEAWGFDFIRPPETKWEVGTKKREGQLFKEAYIKIKDFKSYARLQGKDSTAGMEAFSMLMLDYDFNGDVFDLDAVYYAHQLEQENWEARFFTEHLGEKVMAVFIDIHGNESNIVIDKKQFGISGGNKQSRKQKRK